MILDNSLAIATNLAYNGTSTVLDLDRAGVGKGEPVRLFVQGSADLTGATGITVTDGATSAAADALMSRTMTLAGQTHEVILPQDTNRFLKVVLAGSPSAGSWSCGVVAQPVQSND